MGVYASGPVWGKVVDKRGPRILLASAFTFLLSGYLGIRYFYNSGLPDGVAHLSPYSLVLLAFCSLLTGAGGNGGLTGSVNSTAKTFPDKAVSSTNNAQIGFIFIFFLV